MNIFLKRSKREVTTMIQIKVIKATYIAKFIAFALAITALIAVIVIVTKGLTMNKSIQAFSYSSENSINYTKDNEIYEFIISRTIPTIDVVMNEKKSFELYKSYIINIAKSIIKIDPKNPGTFLSSEIPLLGLVDKTRLNANVNGELGKLIEDNKGVDNKTIQSRGDDIFGDEKTTLNTNVNISKPAIIIYHTHTTEAFTPIENQKYKESGYHKTLDNNYNVCRVGEEIKNYIEKNFGIAVLHDMTVHDYPSYNNSYKRSKPTIEGLIKKYTSAEIIIDLHRDAFQEDIKDIRKKMVVDVSGVKAAKIMFVIGKANPHWKDNYNFSSKVKQKIEEMAPGITKEILARDKIIYNQDISNKALLIEIGADCNTLDEVLVSAKIVAKALGEMLK